MLVHRVLSIKNIITLTIQGILIYLLESCWVKILLNIYWIFVLSWYDLVIFFVIPLHIIFAISQILVKTLRLQSLESIDDIPKSKNNWSKIIKVNLYHLSSAYIPHNSYCVLWSHQRCIVCSINSYLLYKIALLPVLSSQ